VWHRSVYDLFGPAQPYTSLDSFVDGEGLEQQDLVAWVTVGKEHVPRTEDLPLISNFGTYFDILPRNVHRANAAMDVYTLSA
jgi:Cu2+-containing amine oxidase